MRSLCDDDCAECDDDADDFSNVSLIVQLESTRDDNLNVISQYILVLLFKFVG